jgi:hypothetical protein
MALAMAYASGTAKPMVNMAVGANWWEGTTHFNPDTAKDTRPISNGLEAGAGNRNTQKEAKPEFGAGSGGSDWQCPGNHFKGRECGHWNFRNAEKCRKCGSFRRMA